MLNVDKVTQIVAGYFIQSICCTRAPPDILASEHFSSFHTIWMV